jgi:hypothetical protein
MRTFNTKFYMAATCLIVALGCSKGDSNVAEIAAVTTQWHCHGEHQVQTG